MNNKYCYNCKSLLKLEKFHKNSTRKDGLVQECIDCKTSYSKQHYTNTIDKQKDRSKHYYQENKEKWKAKTANRHAAKLLRTPKWANISAINKIYRCCPDGCHVDHVIPLQGKLVSGLHIPENLQYLPAKVNLSKGNKFEV